MAIEKHKPGEISKISGQYPIVGPRGGKTEQERTVVKGKPFPPTQNQNNITENLIKPNSNG